MYFVNFYLGVTQIQQSSLLVLIQSWNRNTIRANVNKPSDPNVCRRMCHNTAFIITYNPQIMHGKQIGNRKQGTLNETYYLNLKQKRSFKDFRPGQGEGGIPIYPSLS